MKSHILTRAVYAAVASVAVMAPLAACSSSGSESSSGEPATATSAPEESSNVDYRDGTYNATGEYGGGPSYLDITVTVADSTITDVTVEPMAENDTSREYQEKFAAAVPDEVVGKSLGEVEVGKLAGSSSCGDGFNDAIAQIRQQASSSEGE